MRIDVGLDDVVDVGPGAGDDPAEVGDLSGSGNHFQHLARLRARLGAHRARLVAPARRAHGASEGQQSEQRDRFAHTTSERASHQTVLVDCVRD